MKLRNLFAAVAAFVILAAVRPALAQNEPAPPDTGAVAPAPAPVEAPAPTVTPAPQALPTPAGVPGAAAAPTLAAPSVSIDYIRPGRAEAAIRRDRDQATFDERDGNLRLLDAREKLLRAKSAVTIQENEIKILEAKQKAAKQAKNAIEQKDAETKLRGEKRRLAVLERLRDVEEAQVSAAEAAIEYARAVAKLCDVENELLAKRGELDQWARAGETVAGDKRARLEKQSWDLEMRVLESTKTRSTRLEDWAQKERNTSNKKLDAYGAYADMLKK